MREPLMCVYCNQVIEYRPDDPVMHVGCGIAEASDEASDYDRLRELSDRATRGPWIRKWASMTVHYPGGDGALESQSDVDFAVAAANYVRDILDGRKVPA